MFIVLRFGDDDQLLVNPNCACKNILAFIREKCDCDKNALVDLCDENGCVKYLHVQPEMDLASNIIENKNTYIPLVVEKNEDQTIKEFCPLLQDCNTHYPALKKILMEQCSRKGNTNTSKGKKAGVMKKRA